MKIFYFDVETTGLNPIKNDIITLSGLMEIDKKVVDSIDLMIQPFNYKNISKKALEINGLTLEVIKTFDCPKVAYKKLIAFFNKYVNKYKKNKKMEDKIIPAGYNVQFDINFIQEFFIKNGDKYLGSYIDYHKLDVASIVLYLKYKGLMNFYGYKLIDVANYLGIKFKAHDAKSDIETTREVCNKLSDFIKVKGV